MSVFICESPDDLKKLLVEAKKVPATYPKGVHLLLWDDAVYLSTFDCSPSGVDDLKNKLLLNSSEYFSLPTSEISVQRAVWSKDGNLRGVYAVVVRKRVREYFNVVRHEGLKLKSITSFPLVIAANFVKEQGKKDEQNMFLHVHNRHFAMIGVVCHQQCVMLRTIKFEANFELCNEIAATALSACANSPIKEWQKLFLLSNSYNQDDLSNMLREKFGDKLNVLPIYKTDDAALEILKPRLMDFMDALLPKEAFRKAVAAIVTMIFVALIAANALLFAMDYQKSSAINKAKLELSAYKR